MRSLKTGNLNVRYAGDDSRPAVVLLHPLSTTGEIWLRFAEELTQAGYRVLAPDLPGPHSAGAGAPLSIPDMSGQVAGVVESLGLGAVSVIGMSMGGCIAQQLALDHPTLVGRLVLADTTSSYGPDRVAKWEDRANSAMTPDRSALLDFQLQRWFTPAFLREDRQECARVAEIFVNVPSAIHAACCRALGAFDTSARLGEIRSPTLVLVGAEDRATPPEMARALATGLPDAHLEIIPDAGHFAMIQSPRARSLALAHLNPAGA
ncbi:MAG TPA: alpha/beta fold hydrolase [Hyphomonadaceae bacterium]|nr:alpha/beta fold hydrolase [Hyphomonadaceae bacterium]